jgi:molecular chaperone IbpA
MSYTYSSGSGNYTFNSLFNDPFFIASTRLIDRFTLPANTGFPPHNVRKVDDETFVLELAVAGYSKESLSITEHDSVLTIKGEKPEIEEEYIHKGIAGRKFTKTFGLDDYQYVDSADLNDGMLYIVLKYNVPEEKKPKTISIK